ncbi:MAG: hypothetical protein FJY47_01285 [Betaproteobacteria bacterium]|nr:hypothetical protein [Betaproteobacteria bacterium]MBM3354452.1 hypothetical protein [Betaproteobacteria bacterium]MBM3386035.1 hypothetical protein [Betaproteobacteria bacterium]
MDLDWEKLVKRYVWNDERTPYLTRVAKLTRTQAQYELFGYALLVGVLFAALSVASLSSELPHGDAAGVSLYAFTVCCAAVLLGATRHPWAALWCAGAPLGLLAYFAAWGFHPGLETGDKALLVAAVLAWLLYSLRVVAVARAWQGLAGPG